VDGPQAGVRGANAASTSRGGPSSGRFDGITCQGVWCGRKRESTMVSPGAAEPSVWGSLRTPNPSP